MQSGAAPEPRVVINEIHFSPPDKRPLEFIELHQAGGGALELGGWTLNEYAFPPGAALKADGYLVVAADPAAFEKEFGFKPLGPFTGKLKRSGTEIRLSSAQGRVVDAVRYGTGFPWPTAPAGTGCSLERVHPALPAMEPASWRASGFPVGTVARVPLAPLNPDSSAAPLPPLPAARRPTPGSRNSTYTEIPLPAILGIRVAPEQPKAGAPVTVSVQLAAPSAATRVTLRLQDVEPGKYIRYSDAAFQTNWVDLPMRADPSTAGVYTVTVPASWQQHRHLVRYRVQAVAERARVEVPYPDDAVPNFAWFVYDGPPAWTGASQPGRTPPWTFPPSLLETLPTYHLIARTDDVARSQWNGNYNRRPFFGTLVYDGRVYDHIRFHNRGQASTYNTGKNKWGFKFNAAHAFEARDNYGRAYRAPWSGLDLNACASPWVQMNRGMAGLDEALSFRSMQLAGVPAANTHWLHFRVISSDQETSTNQYAGDLWGLYLAVQSMGGAWLEDLGLPEGNVFSKQSGLKHAARGMPADGSDWTRFQNGMFTQRSLPWWRTNLNLPAFYSFNALNRLLSNVDLREDANHGYYHAPDGRWAPIPWDNDMMFIPHSHQSGVIEAHRCLALPALQREYQNRAREILDLFASDNRPEGGQFAQLVAEYARILCPPGQPRTWPELDMAKWNWHPRSLTRGVFYLNPYTHGWSGVPFRRVLDTADFPGFCRYIVNFCTDSRRAKNYRPDDNNPVGYGWGVLAFEARDEQIPERPTVTYTGPSGYPTNGLTFSVSSFRSPGGAAFAAVQWRVARIAAPGLAGYEAGRPFRYELTPVWQGPELTQAAPALQLPPEACSPGGTYRVRARYKDATQRWSHWSEPVQFVTTGPK